MPAEKQDIVIISSIEWDAAWQRHQIFATQFAAAGHRVFFIENTGFRSPGIKDISRVGRKVKSLLSKRRSAREAPPGIDIINPVVFPPTAKPYRAINRSVLVPQIIKRLKALGLKPDPVVIVYMPTATTLELIGRLDPPFLVYDCASHFAANPAAPADFIGTEARLLDNADVVVTDSDFLFNLMKPRHPNVIQVHQGVSAEFFQTAPARSDWRRFCFYGTWVADMNVQLVNALAESGFEVAVSGFMRGEPPKFHPSIRRLDPAPRQDLPKRLEQFDVFLLPHRITEFHKAVIPAKIYECLAMGRPVIATPLPSLQAFKDLMYIGGTPEEWVGFALNLSKTESAALRDRRIALAREHTNEKEFSKFYGAISFS